MSAQEPTSTIRTGAELVTVVNGFDVAAERQRDLIVLLDRATEDVMRHRPGFVFANIHRSLDGTRVANYAQWESMEAFQATMGDPAARSHVEATTEFATASPGLYEVASVHCAPR